MFKTLTIIFALLLYSPVHMAEQRQDETYVYICTGRYAYSYHSYDNCSGLKRCNAEIKKVTLSEAKQKKRTPCLKCY